MFIFFILSLLCSDYVADSIKNLELRLIAVLVKLQNKFGHVQNSVPKIGIPMSKTACTNL